MTLDGMRQLRLLPGLAGPFQQYLTQPGFGVC
jgi:hypothetical protein